MLKEFEKLGFKKPDFLINPYGIKIIIGTEGKEDWNVVIPKSLCKKKCPGYAFGDDVWYYLVSEEMALMIVQEFTEFAKKNENVGGKTNG